MQININGASLVIGIVVGGAMMSLLRQPATAQTVPPHSPWVYGESAVNSAIPTAWKLNTQTGEIRYCFFNGMQNRGACLPIPEGTLGQPTQ
jgi:hypothetical protein